jgi:hypothetical protein
MSRLRSIASTTEQTIQASKPSSAANKPRQQTEASAQLAQHNSEPNDWASYQAQQARVLGTAGNLRIIKTGLQQILEQNNAAQTRLHSTVISNYSAANSLHKQIKKERGATTESDLESQIK